MVVVVVGGGGGGGLHGELNNEFILILGQQSRQ